MDTSIPSSESTSTPASTSSSSSSSSSDVLLPLYVVQEGQYVILTKGEFTKLTQVHRGKDVKVGKLSLKLDSAIGQPLDAYYEVSRDGLKRFDMNDVLAEVQASGEGSNQFLTDEGESQKLSAEQIQDLKKTSGSGQEVIQQLVENSSTFKQKTEFSQAKYIKKKQLRHLNVVRISRPTAQTLCDMLFLSDPFKILQLRSDSLAHLLLYANVRAGIKAMVVDACGGLITGAVAERMGGFGSLLQIHASDLPLKTYIDPFNLAPSSSSIIKYLSFLHLGRILLSASSKPQQQQQQQQQSDETSMLVDEASTTTPTPKELEREETASYFRSGNFDSLIIATRHNPSSVLFPLLNYMAPSRPFAVYCQFMEPLIECASKLRKEGIAVNVQLLEVCFTHYQVLPNRTHPDMTTSATGGYILFGTVVASRSLVTATSSSSSSSTITSVKRTASDANENEKNNESNSKNEDENEDTSSTKRARVD